MLRTEIWNSISSGVNTFLSPSSDWASIQNGDINLLDKISSKEVFELVMGGPIVWAVKTTLQILSYVAGIFWLLGVWKSFLKKSRHPGQNIQIKMNRERNERKKVGNWHDGLQYRNGRHDEPPPPYNL